MKYYSEEEIRIRLAYLGYNQTVSTAIINGAKPTEWPTLESSSSDRERIRMELWKDMMVMHAGSTIAVDYATQAIEAFDKKFPNS